MRGQHRLPGCCGGQATLHLCIRTVRRALTVGGKAGWSISPMPRSPFDDGFNSDALTERCHVGDGGDVKMTDSDQCSVPPSAGT